jgi:pimeloyl-ACP methyl ester carboxylesterase
VEPLVEYTDEFAGYRTRVLELEGSGPPLVLFHGYADSADTWRLVLDRLARERRRAIAVDLPGFGAAAPLVRGPILPQLDRFGAAVSDSVARAHGELVAVGNSLGGVVALRLAQTGHEAVTGCVPIAPAGLDMPRWFSVVERDRLVRAVTALPVPVPEAVVRRLVGQAYRQLAFSKPALATPEIVHAFTSHHRDLAAVNRVLDTGRRLLPELSGPFRLAEVRCPVLLIWGSRDRMVSHRGSERLLAALPGVRYELLDGCGHCPQLEAPDRVVELLRDFPDPIAQAA